MKTTSFTILLIVAIVVVSGFAVYSNFEATTDVVGSYVMTDYPAVPEGTPCYDSDGGENFYVKGTVSVGDFAWDDMCDIRSGMLVENWCGTDNGKTVKLSIYKFCTAGCYNGACN